MIKIRREIRFALAFAAITSLLFLGGFDNRAFAYGKVSVTEGLALWKALVLGLIEGLTEFLPISSTGHLLAAKEFMDLGQTEASEQAIDSYIIAIQIGAIFAILILYKNRIVQMYEGARGNNIEGKIVLRNLILAFIPTGIIGVLLSDPVKDRLYDSQSVAYAWIVGGICILVAHNKKWLRHDGFSIETLGFQGAILVGIAQALALWPGVSRSLVTILALLALGLSITAAVEFSFLLGLVTLSAATIYELSQEGGTIINVFGYWTPLIGLVSAFVSAVISVKWMVAWLESKSFTVFGFYRIGVGVLALVFIASDVL